MDEFGNITAHTWAAGGGDLPSSLALVVSNNIGEHMRKIYQFATLSFIVLIIAMNFAILSRFIINSISDGFRQAVISNYCSWHDLDFSTTDGSSSVIENELEFTQRAYEFFIIQMGIFITTSTFAIFLIRLYKTKFNKIG